MSDSKATGAAAARSSWVKAVYDWVVTHDDSWLFIGLYVGLAVVLSIWISLFWLVAVVAVHFAFEVVRQNHLQPGFWGVLSRVLWELKLDFGLVLFAVVLALYMEVTLGLVGLGSAARAGSAAARAGTVARVGLLEGSRLAAWLRVLGGGQGIAALQRVLRGILLSLDDAAHVVRAVFSRRSRAQAAANPAAARMAGAGKAAQADTASEPTPGGWGGRWGAGDYIAIGLAVICVGLTVAAPWLTPHTADTMFETLAAEFHPLGAGN